MSGYDNVSDDLQLAFDASNAASKLALVHFEGGVCATLKADGTPVTEADRAVERLLRQTLSQGRPHDAFLGEELGRLCCHGLGDRGGHQVPLAGAHTSRRGHLGTAG
ncbi:MAG: hypothetical protein M0Z87_09035 [Actinomycetota bacterium]|nr:hypothetical protein [Actinomycetota bacterium]